VTAKVLIERHGRTWLVLINRPEVRNCVDGETAQGLFEAVEEFKADDSLDVMILAGAPSEDVAARAFCSGADLKNTPSLGARPGARARLPARTSGV